MRHTRHPATDDSATAAMPEAMTSSASRRRFLTQAATLMAGAAAVPAQAEADVDELEPWQRVPGAPLRAYGQPSPHEAAIQRWVVGNAMVPGNGASWSPLQDLEGIITPSGLHFERHHNGVPQIDPAANRLAIMGEVEHPTEYDLATLLAAPRVSRICFIECGGNSNAGWRRKAVQSTAGGLHGLVSCSEWTGIPLAWAIDRAQPHDGAKWLIVEGADAISHIISVPVELVIRDGVLALFQNGERLRPEQGYPLRLVLPGLEGVLNCKWVRRLTLSREPVLARNETARYSELQPSGKAHAFTFRMAPKSLICMPSPGHRLERDTNVEISGLAWSGHGRVAQVEVSTDGGHVWQTARLESPVLPCCFTRFRQPWLWNGRPARLQSRVMDETGLRQPTRAELIAKHGHQGYFHYNGIVNWDVAEDGRIKHAYMESDSSEDDLDNLFLNSK